MSSSTTTQSQLARSLHPKAQKQYDQGAVDPQFKFSYVTLLTSPSASQQRALDKLLADQQDPASPNYHKWLTPEQYGERFGLSQNDLSKITAWLKAQGFTVLSVAPGRNSIIVSGTAAQFESAFQTEFHRYNVDGESHIANATPLKIPAAWSGIVTVVRGLHDFRMKPMGVRKGLHPNYYDNIFTIPDFIAPGDIATIYDIKPLYAAGFDGTGQKLAVVGQTDIYLADINDFRSGFGLSQISGCTTNTNGVITACSSSSSNLQYIRDPLITDPGIPDTCGNLEEADLDIEWSGATARNAQIIYVNSPATFDPTCTNFTNNGGVENALSLAIQQKVAPVVSMSYGICELFAINHETELQQANSQGMTIVNSTGDTGAAGCDGVTNSTTTPPNLAVLGLAVSYPASSQYVTGLGGTEVPFNDFTTTFWGTANGTDGGSALGYVPEEAWNDDFEFAAFCAANPSNSICTGITSQATAQTVLGIGSGGGGASNCFTQTAQGVCTAGFPKPAWQTFTISGPASARYVPDVSLLASADFPGYILCTPLSELGLTGTSSSCAPGGATGIANALALKDSKNNPVPSVIGGTSVGAAVFAGIVTILNQYLSGPSAPGLGNINPTLYALAATPSNNAFHPVNTGNNIVSCQPLTPSNQPVALQCPSTGPSAGLLGFDAANFDTKTHYNLVTSLGSVDANALAVAWAAGRTASTTTVAAAPTSVVLGQNVTLTATVTPATAVGSVSFFNNSSTTALGTGTLSGGVATFQTTSLPLGTDNITAMYNGDGTNAPSTAAGVVVTVTAPDFTWTSSDLTHTVKAGQTSMVYHFTATPVGATTFGAAVTFGCSFSPTDATLSSSSCTFTPASIATGAGATLVSLTITTTGPNTGTGSAVQHRADKRAPWLPLGLPIAGMVMVGLVGRRVSRHSAVAGLYVSLALIGLMVDCGGGRSGPPPVTVTPSSAQVQLGKTQQFSASASVTWSLSAGAIGTIDSTSGLYTAPSTGTTPASFTVTATPQTGAPATASITIPAVGVSVSPNTTVNLWPTVAGWPAQTQAFTATVSNATNTAVNWSVSSGGGSIDANGNYTAPATVPNPAMVTVTATSVADPSKSGPGTVNIQTPTTLGTFTVTVTATEASTVKSPTVQLTVQ